MEPRAHTSPAAATSGDAMPSLDGLRLLVIDDEAMTREVIAAMLRRSGAVVDLAATVADAHTCVAEHRFDVILCDIAMPGEDGFAFLRALRKGGADIPVIALTAFGRPDDRTRALEAGFNGYVKKPVDPVLLATTVREVSARA